MAGVQDISPSTFISDSLALLMGNFFAVLGHSSGSAFPTENLRESMFFFHTSQKKIYVLARITPSVVWNEILDLNVLLNTGGNRMAYIVEVTEALATKQPNIGGAATTVLSANLAAGKVVVSNGDGKLAASNLDATKLGFLANLTSDAQQQLDAKQRTVIISTVVPSSSDGQNGDIWMVVE